MTRKPNPHERRPQWYATPAASGPARPRTLRALAVGGALGAGLLAVAVLLAKPLLGALGVAVFVVLVLTGNASS
ncbi:hypothetical protein ABT390_19830 [Streptomyces aurantiacus]|uniref:Uncharacterized protein n=1 Tax=Streptomyces aurantiacus JA 4570 TaxID=1286094 RepID=S3Z9Y8_9ACTN|nr:hypothetical protein [Streptomyces aurantiacus]EPH39938.1 hypothetical protein STRAU_6996 [Streptomyces aurantiacus JA 4570]